jgi:hypothetical protein
MASTSTCARCGLEIEIKGDHAEVDEAAWEHNCQAKEAEDPEECPTFEEAAGDRPVETR